MAAKYWITFLTDYGLENKFIGVCHGVIGKIAPNARVMDVTHLVPRGNVGHGAEIFRQSIPFLPPGVHLSVVDPGVGTSRRAVALVVGEGVFVGPDNGLLMPAADEMGGVEAAYELTNPMYHLKSVSNSFHGRDIFSPVAAHLAAGVSPSELGPAVDVGDLVRLPKPVLHREGETLHGEVMIEDRFGNLQTSINSELLAEMGSKSGDTFTLTAGDIEIEIPYVETFASVGKDQPLVHVDSADRLAIAVNLGSAAEMFSLNEGDNFSLRRG